MTQIQLLPEERAALDRIMGAYTGLDDLDDLDNLDDQTLLLDDTPALLTFRVVARTPRGLNEPNRVETLTFEAHNASDAIRQAAIVFPTACLVECFPVRDPLECLDPRAIDAMGALDPELSALEEDLFKFWA